MSSDMVYLLKAQIVTKEKEKSLANVTKSEECDQCEELAFDNVTDYLQHFREEFNFGNPMDI